MLPTIQQHTLLTFGYIRETKPADIPYPLKKMMLAFYNDVNTVTYKNQSVQTFLNYPNNKYFTPWKAFHFKGIKFQIRIYPNGRKSHELGSLTFGIHCRSHSMNINKITIYYELYCYDTAQYIKGTQALNFNTTKQGFNSIYSFPWFKRSKCKNKKSISLATYIHIREICLKTYKSITFNEAVKFQKRFSFNWCMTHKLLVEIKSENIDGERCYFSPNFGNYNNWYFRFRPDRNDTYIALLHRNLPHNVSQIDVEYYIVLTCCQQSHLKKKKLSIKKCESSGTELKFFGVGWTDIVGSNELQITIDLDVVGQQFYK